MTVRLLAALGQYPANAIVTFATAVETSLVAEKLASTDLTGGVVYRAPVDVGRAGEAVRWVTDADGNPVDLLLPGTAGRGGAAAVVGASGVLYSNSAPSGIELFGPDATASVVPVISNGAQCTINSSGVRTINGEPWFTVSATATGGSTNWFEIKLNNLSPFASDTLALEFLIDDPVSVTGIAAYMGTSGYSSFALASQSMVTADNGASPFVNRGRLALSFGGADWTKTAT